MVRLAFRLAIVAVLIFAFVRLVGTDRVNDALHGGVRAVTSLPDVWDDARREWRQAERKADRERERAGRP